jgi:hypothetical protein
LDATGLSWTVLIAHIFGSVPTAYKLNTRKKMFELFECSSYYKSSNHLRQNWGKLDSSEIPPLPFELNE